MRSMGLYAHARENLQKDVADSTAEQFVVRTVDAIATNNSYQMMSSTNTLSSFQHEQSEMSSRGEAPPEESEEFNSPSPTCTLSPTRYSFAKNFLVSMVSKMG